MPKKRKKPASLVNLSAPVNELSERIKKASSDLWYISETDAGITPFAGKAAEAVTKENLLAQIGKPVETPVEERDFADFFLRLTKIQEWFGDQEKANAEKFAVLRDLMQQNLRDLKVFKIGKIELDVFAVGLDENGNLTGIQTKAVET